MSEANSHPDAPRPPFPDEALAELRQRVDKLEVEVTKLRDTAGLENRIMARVMESLPAGEVPKTALFAGPPPPPGFRDLALPLPTGETLAAVAKSPFTLARLLTRFRLYFWTLLDRRYPHGWLTRGLVALLLVGIFLSDWCVPFAAIPLVGDLVGKVGIIVMTMLLFLILENEAQRYEAWRSGKEPTHT